MKNFIQEGNSLTVTAPYAVSSGGGVLVGSLFGIAATTAAQSDSVVIVAEGVFDLVKVSAQAWTAGALVYWDDTAKVATTTAATNKLIGVATAAAANPSAVGRVRLNGAFVA